MRDRMIRLQLIAGLIFAGLGHHFVSSLRDVYPIDGFVFYAIALILFVRVWRAVTQDADRVWATLRDAARLTGMAQRDLVLLMSIRSLARATMGLNVLAAVLAFLLPSLTGLWLIPWAVSIAILAVRALPPSSIRTSAESRSLKDARVWTEPEEAIGRAPGAIGLALALTLLIGGQFAVSSDAASSAPSGLAAIADSLNVSLKLSLGGDVAGMLGGGLALIAGSVIFAVVTRRGALADRPRFTSEAPTSGGRLSNQWLIVAVIGMAIWLGVIQAIGDGATGWGGVLPWLLAIGLMGACWWKIDRLRGVRHAIALDRVEALALGLAAMAILIVFTFRLADVPNSIWGDEGAFFTLAHDIAAGQFTPDFFGLGTYNYPVAGSIYQSIWLSLFGATVWAWRLGSVVPALLAVVPMYFLTRATLGRRVAWLSLALYATSPYTLAYARLGYNNSQSVLPVALTLALTWLAIRRDSRLFAFAAGCAGGLGFFTYTAAQLGPVLALGWLGWIWITHSARRRSLAQQMAVYALGVLLVAAPSVVYGVTRYPDLFAYKRTEALFANVFYARDLFPDEQLFALSGPIQVGSQQLFFAPDVYAVLLARGVLRTALSFHVPALITQHYLVGALAGPIGMAYLLGLGWCLARVRRPGYMIWPAWLVIGALSLSGISGFPPQDAHMVPVIPSLAVLGALGFVLAVDLGAAMVGGLCYRVKLMALAGTVIVLGFFGLRAYFVEMPARFPPDVANAVLWQVQQMPRGSDITLIASDSFPDDFQPWGLRELGPGVTFHLLKPDALASTDLRDLCPGQCRFFFVATVRGQALPQLAQVFGNGLLTEYPDANGAIQAYAFAP